MGMIDTQKKKLKRPYKYYKFMQHYMQISLLANLYHIEAM